jgi:peptide/nickel transport system ATP-binding protein
MLQVRNLCTRFRLRHGVAKAVDDVSFDLDRGKVLAIIGESGSGKSVTALSLMNLVDPPGEVTGGSIRFNGEELRTATPRRWNGLRGNRIAMVFQDPMMSLNPVLRIGTQVAETVRVHRPVSSRAAWQAALDALERVGIPAPAERMRAYPHQLSGGMRQRVAIANAIVNQPDLIIADEPTTALDVTIQAQILYEMKRLTRESGTALLWISHDLGVVKDLADEVCVMYAGRVVEWGPVAQVIAAPRHPYTRGLIDSLPQAGHKGSRLQSIRGATPSLLALPPGCTFAPRCDRATGACSAVPALEQSAQRSYRCFHPVAAPQTSPSETA